MKFIMGISCTKNIKKCRCFYRLFSWHVLILLFFAPLLHAQDFEVTGTPQHELCPGNGSLTLSTQNAVPDVTVNYKVYKLPNTTTAIFNSSGTFVGNLNDGTYLIIATQVVNGTPVQDTTEVIIEDQTVLLDYDIEVENALCGPDGSMTITTVTGNPVTYEIIAGPVTIPPQASNILANIPTGTYTVRVTDNCGTGIVTTQFVPSDASVLEIGIATFPDIQLPACDLITLAHEIAPVEEDMEPQLPLNATITLYPPDGTGPIVYTQTITILGDGPDLVQVIPFYYDTPYYYDLEIVDACGVVYNVEDNLVNQRMVVNGGYGDAGCPGKFLQISIFKYVAPYTVTFSSFPEDFDPEMNPLHPDFFENVTDYGSEDDEIAVPYGTYIFTVEDSCGRSSGEITVVIEEQEVNPTVSTFPANCQNGMGGVEINITGFEMVSAVITAAPEEFGEAPIDVSEYIDDEFKLVMENLLPVGEYEITVVDECDRPYELEFEIGFSTWPNINGNVRVDCQAGVGTMRIFSTTSITKVIITQAPAAFGQTMPYDASFNISPEGDIKQWYMNNLPPGTYKFLIDDECISNFEYTRTVSGYNTTQDELTVTRHCGSFDLLLNHTTTSSVFLYYGLQKEISPGVWGHPGTGAPYTEGTEVNGTTAYQISSNITAFSLDFTGKFRIVKYYKAYGTGRADDATPNEVNCIEILHEFEFLDDLQLITIISLTCSGDVADVQVIAQGAEPITYEITHKNGVPFSIPNNNNNIFTGLESAEYTLRIQDPCGNFLTPVFNVADLPSLVNATAPGDMELCDGDGDGSEIFDLNAQTPVILDGQSPLDYTVSYHTSLADADAGTNPLPLNCNTPSSTIYARVIHNVNTACHAVTDFEVTVNESPELDMDDSYAICEGEQVTITAPAGYDVYRWNGIELGPTITVNQGGPITLEVENEYGCTATKNLIVSASQAPHIATIQIDDWTDVNNTITVIVEDSPSLPYFEYSLDGINYQTGNVFYNLPPGPYTVYVRDTFDCGMDQGEVYLLTYPRFFTPNGDGINDFWRIQFSHMEPDMLIYIYDRFGKIVSSFDANNPGWDGTYNGARLPATDYWFVVKRQNGKEYKGHFSMMR
jgi:gliding motility-associated-like protein